MHITNQHVLKLVIARQLGDGPVQFVDELISTRREESTRPSARRWGISGGGDPQHQVRKEDVMEAPKVIPHFENLDAQHDQPGLQAPVYHDIHGLNRQFTKKMELITQKFWINNT